VPAASRASLPRSGPSRRSCILAPFRRPGRSVVPCREADDDAGNAPDIPRKRRCVWALTTGAPRRMAQTLNNVDSRDSQRTKPCSSSILECHATSAWPIRSVVRPREGTQIKATAQTGCVQRKAWVRDPQAARHDRTNADSKRRLKRLHATLGAGQRQQEPLFRERSSTPSNGS
jgi:hypothetical protein